jgi:NTP pyrophosphatase (non-canonical NTP hydrolase)
MDLDATLKIFQTIAEANNWTDVHSPKNLAIAVSNEASELLNEFQWVPEGDSWGMAQDEAARARIAAEAADVFMYLVALCDKLDIDLEQAVSEKAEANCRRFLPE